MKPAESLLRGVNDAVVACSTVTDSGDADTAGGGSAVKVIVLVATCEVESRTM